MADEQTPECNICGGTSFGPFVRRPIARCTQCGSLERSRAIMHLVKTRDLVRPGMKIIHFAPERSVGAKLMSIVGRDNYEAYDLFPDQFDSALNVQKFDLTEASTLPSGRYDLVLHSHILEHIPCYVAVVLWHLHRSLTKTGTHLFCIPVARRHHSESDFTPLSDDVRLARFGQRDHCRIFGQEDLGKTIGQVFDLTSETSGLTVPEAVALRHNFDVEEVRRTIFAMRKTDLLLSEARFQ